MQAAKATKAMVMMVVVAVVVAVALALALSVVVVAFALSVAVAMLTSRQICGCQGFFVTQTQHGLHRLQQPLMQALSRVAVPAVMERSVAQQFQGMLWSKTNTTAAATTTTNTRTMTRTTNAAAEKPPTAHLVLMIAQTQRSFARNLPRGYVSMYEHSLVPEARGLGAQRRGQRLRVAE